MCDVAGCISKAATDEVFGIHRRRKKALPNPIDGTLGEDLHVQKEREAYCRDKQKLKIRFG
jgi:hypothetical protein